MSTQDNLEKILRSMHVLIAKGEPAGQSRDRVIVSKQELLGLLKDLNICVYNIMDEYEMTQQSHDEAERKSRRKGEKIVKDAGKMAEDVYAASVMYTNEALNHIQRIIQNASDSMDEVFAQMKNELEERKDTVRENQLELEGQLHDLADTKKYLQIIEERNKELEKERQKKKTWTKTEKKKSPYPEPEIKINKEYFIQNGIPLEEEREEASDTKEETEAALGQAVSELMKDQEKESELPKEAPEIKVNLDAEYFKWKQQQNDEKGED